METPLDNVPPLFMSVAPLGAGLGFAAGCWGGGGVGAIGAAGSVFRLLENICIWKNLLPGIMGHLFTKVNRALRVQPRPVAAFARGRQKARLHSARARGLEEISLSARGARPQRSRDAPPPAFPKSFLPAPANQAGPPRPQRPAQTPRGRVAPANRPRGDTTT